MLTKSNLRTLGYCSIAFAAFATQNPIRDCLMSEIVYPLHGVFINRWQKERKRDLFYEALRGETVEILPTSGQNFESIPKSVSYSAIEPSESCVNVLRDSAAEASFPLPTLTIEHADVLQWLKSQPDATVDCVLATFALSRVSQPQTVVDEVHRVLRPGGRFVFVDYCARDDNFVMRGLQFLISPIYNLFLDINLHHNPEVVCGGCSPFGPLISSPFAAD